MTNNEIAKLSAKILYGLKLSEYRMLKEKAMHDEDIIVCDKNNKIVRIPAKIALAKLDQDATYAAIINKSERKFPKL